MKLQFRHQPFQADAANAVCDVFAGQPFRTPTYMIDAGLGSYQQLEQKTIPDLATRPSLLTTLRF